MKPQTFSHVFSIGGLCATITVFPEQIRTGGGLVCNWNRRPTREQLAAIMPEYLAWKSDCIQAIADEIGGRVLDLVQVGPDSWLPREFAPKGGQR